MRAARQLVPRDRWVPVPLPWPHAPMSTTGHPWHPLRGVDAEPFTLPVAAVLRGTSFQPAAPEWRRGGPRAVCAWCGALYSTSAAAPIHPCLVVQRAPTSPWDAAPPQTSWPRELRELERPRPRIARGRPQAPHVRVSAPLSSSGRVGPAERPSAASRRRCFVCRRRLGEAEAVSVLVEGLMRGFGLVYLERHPWCRARRAA